MYVDLALLNIVIPMLASIGPLLIRKRETIEKYAITVALMTLIVSLLSIAEFYKQILEAEHQYVHYAYRISKLIPFFDFELFIDKITLVMIFVVSFISFLVVVFSKEYMGHDKGYVRYYTLILLFIGSMIGLVYSGNLLWLYFFWEIVGITSCLLIAHWYERKEAAFAGIKAFITTRFGDIFFLLGIGIAFVTLGNYAANPLSFKVFIEHASAFNPKLLTFTLLLFLGGAIGKSAQFPLYFWLPDAMEGPTTVSALIHAATMVKAGVYLVARVSSLAFEYGGLSISNAYMFFLTTAFIGGFTAFYASLLAFGTMDLKRILAFSTISQLGYMFLALGLGGFIGIGKAIEISMYHLSSHAIFKALLFLAAAAIIHELGTRDMRMMGGLRKYMPLTYTTFIIASLSLMGIPPTAGFWSKEAIVSEALNVLHKIPIPSLLAIVTVGITASYIARAIYRTFIFHESDHVLMSHPRDPPAIMLWPLLILSAFVFPVPLIFGTLFLLPINEIFHITPLSATLSLSLVLLGLLLTHQSYRYLAFLKARPAFRVIRKVISEEFKSPRIIRLTESAKKVLEYIVVKIGISKYIAKTRLWGSLKIVRSFVLHVNNLYGLASTKIKTMLIHNILNIVIKINETISTIESLMTIIANDIIKTFYGINKITEQLDIVTVKLAALAVRFTIILNKLMFSIDTSAIRFSRFLRSLSQSPDQTVVRVHVGIIRATLGIGKTIRRLENLGTSLYVWFTFLGFAVLIILIVEAMI